MSISDKKRGGAYGGGSTSCDADDIFDFRSGVAAVHMRVRCAQDVQNKIAP